ncbi:MAG TPA: UDP-N-acetylglucosamine--N-acetylmuramyl-(pentapeptide) pyrophosphoryl-undecaprenol N-acetylglucosamine transferase, partial [Fervidobacterium nodosum]|nr:UDP-N-acetylglucosamine--N-acetylmuramyl-(pentapeptide) pyrophosphoryl-undecaprenol N-acetylglucosamine transferase [Fervidobacterium nodosum]
MKKLKIAAAGGVTGGHLYPNIAVLEEFQKRYDIEILYFCVSEKIEERLLPVVHPEFKRYTINVKGLRRPVFHPENIIRFSKLISNSKKIQEELKKFSPDFVYVSGGYVSYPVAKAAKRLGIPVFVQEQNTLPGKANIAISKFAKRVFLSFEESIQRFPKKIHNKIEVVGNPIWARDGKVELPHPTVIVIGGSGGSEFLNKITLEIALEMPDVNFILSSGGKKLDGTVPNNVQVKDYIDNMYAYWRSVDAAITRGGATTISELIYFNVPAIVVPWEGSTESHQILNAKIIEKEQLGV